MNKNRIKKIAACSLAFAVTVTSVGIYNVEKSYAVDDQTVLRETAEEALGSSSSSGKGAFKDETVYVKADASGNVDETTVTEWLKNPKKGSVSDYTTLKDIENVKGDETFKKGDNNKITWESKGEDIYYQGTTDKELPIAVKVTYKLNGKEISPKDLEGKSGRVEIRFDYSNRSFQTVTVNGKTMHMQTPFTVATAMMLPIKGFSNVSIDNGKIVSDADRQVAVGLAFPGLAGDLNLRNYGIDIPESMTIRADVEDMEIPASLTLASAELFSGIDWDNIDGFDDLQGALDKLNNATDRLVKGSRDAADGAKILSTGVNTLQSKSRTLITGLGTLSSGMTAYSEGVNKVSEGASQLIQGTDAVKGGIGGAVDGISALSDGADKLVAGYDGEKGLAKGAESLKNGLAGLNNAVPEVAVSQEQINTLAAGLAQKAAESLPEEVFAGMGMTKTAYVQVLTDGYAQAIKANLADPVNSSFAEIKKNTGTLAAGSESLYKGVTQLRDGTVKLQQGIGQMQEKTGSMIQGFNTLSKGCDALNEGAVTLNQSSAPLLAGMNSLSSGGSLLSSGINVLAKGADQLASGNQTLADGMLEYKTTGIDKLTGIFGGNIGNLTIKIDAMKKLSNDYKSYAGIGKGYDGVTKFIIETTGSSKSEK